MTVERAYFDTMDRERSIKHLMNFNESVDKWIVMWEHNFNEKESMMRNEFGELISLNLVGKMNLRDAIKGGCVEVFQMYTVVNDPSRQLIHYLDINFLYPYIMAHAEFPVGHPEICRGDYSCHNQFSDSKRHNVTFISVCLVRVLAPRGGVNGAVLATQDRWKVDVFFV